MSTNMIGHVRRVRKVDPNGNIYYDRGVSDVIFDPVRGVSVKKDIDDLRAGMLTALQFVAANPKGMDGMSAYEIAVEHGYEGTEEEWVWSLKGDPGRDGLSAYEIAVLNHGYLGTEEEWLEYLRQGDPGKSAYDSAVEGGFEGSEEEFNKSLAESAKTESIALTEDEIQAIYNNIYGSTTPSEETPSIGEDNTGESEAV